VRLVQPIKNQHVALVLQAEQSVGIRGIDNQGTDRGIVMYGLRAV
jgi:hypothetical protein